MYNWLHRVWYDSGSSFFLLVPLSGLYWLLITTRRFLYRVGLFSSRRAAVPVIVVGNITTGGTGKTPFTIWLAKELAARGFSPGIVSRGYGGSKSSTSMRVDSASDPAIVGDEPVLLARSAACPVVVDRDRVRATEMLVADGADVIIADDGLQHYRLARSYEVCVVDGLRGLGNRRLLPAGPLREPSDRLNEVDCVVLNGALQKMDAALTTLERNCIEFELRPSNVVRLNGSLTKPIAEMADTTVHAVAAIGNPQRFFDLLRAHNMQVIEHAYPDHAVLSPDQLQFGDDFNVIMTEKDAVKLGGDAADKFWVLPVELSMDPLRAGPLLEEIVSRIEGERVSK